MRIKGIHIACTKALNTIIKQNALSNSIYIEDGDLIETFSAIDETIIPYLNNREYTYVFTSSKAVKCFIEHNRDNINTFANNCFAISGNTFQSLATTSLKIIDTANDSEALAEKIIEHQHKLLVHFTAIEHRMELYKTLAKSNIECETCFVYAKKSIAKKFDAKDAVLFFSPSQVDTFLTHNTIVPSTPIFCIGLTTANHVKTIGFNNIITSPEPTQEALLKKVYQHFKIHNEYRPFTTKST